jgi:hypothetical protein
MRALVALALVLVAGVVAHDIAAPNVHAAQAQTRSTLECRVALLNANDSNDPRIDRYCASEMGR